MTPSTSWKETIAPGEAERFEAYGQELAALQRKNATDGKLHRALHAKAPPGLQATFTVLPDLPAHARVGLFATPKAYPAYVRFSNGSGAHQPDRKPDVRGIAIKLVGVGGRKLIPGMESAPTQDFLMITSAATPVRNADEFLGLVRMVAAPLTGLPKLLRQIGLKRFLQIAKAGSKSLGVPTTSLATRDYFSALPSQFGEHAVHFRLRPHAQPAASAVPKTPHYLIEEITERIAREPVSFDFQAQFFVDDARTPIEDASVEWREADAPFVALARLDIDKQDPASARGKKLQHFIETLAFDPWHSQVELKPLGNMMRARNVAYRISTQARNAAPEPDGSESF